MLLLQITKGGSNQHKCFQQQRLLSLITEVCSPGMRQIGDILGFFLRFPQFKEAKNFFHFQQNNPLLTEILQQINVEGVCVRYGATLNKSRYQTHSPSHTHILTSWPGSVVSNTKNRDFSFQVLNTSLRRKRQKTFFFFLFLFFLNRSDVPIRTLQLPWNELSTLNLVYLVCHQSAIVCHYTQLLSIAFIFLFWLPSWLLLDFQLGDRSRSGTCDVATLLFPSTQTEMHSDGNTSQVYKSGCCLPHTQLSIAICQCFNPCSLQFLWVSSYTQASPFIFHSDKS